jgi:hypothetical protein
MLISICPAALSFTTFASLRHACSAERVHENARRARH